MNFIHALDPKMLHRSAAVVEQSVHSHEGSAIPASQMGCATPAADAVWNALPVAVPDRYHLAANRIVTWDQNDPLSAGYDLIRTRIMHRMLQNGWRSLAITAPGAGSGKTLTSINLAFSIARRHSMRSLLVELDSRRPKVANYIGLPRQRSVVSYMRDDSSEEQPFLRCSSNLAVGTCRIGDSGDQLFDEATPDVVERLVGRLGLDVVIFDLPPMLEHDDALSFAPGVDCALLVLEAGVTTSEEASFCERELSQVTNIVGIVLNKCR
ncbi:CpsD/CapB family tyrosine-protein kinase [Aliihoeflea sp. 40Bstr573]|uniref:CpsD/CapB family tyrosine-protein kinase n=1 Tax=Aliihoeflea sp. 40Bstr573 TaxID=2696467 RepID=UPI0020953F2B|nr:CpsD/CapB family tyrosine-protein kinase [Aliihoeflea sp. 40Bstr573]MCO6388791.1 hypothetical protein [Aliihoeflea sp. 40Bstr573]